MLTVLQPPRPAITAAEGEGYRCPDARTLSDSLPFPKNVVMLAGKLREAYEFCRTESDALIGVASMVPSAAPVSRTPGVH